MICFALILKILFYIQFLGNIQNNTDRLLLNKILVQNKEKLFNQHKKLIKISLNNNHQPRTKIR